MPILVQRQPVGNTGEDTKSSLRSHATSTYSKPLVRNIEGHYLLMVDEDARLQWPRPVVNEVASFLACTKIFGTVVLTSAYGPELGLPDDIAHVLGDVIMATLPGRCRWEGEA